MFKIKFQKIYLQPGILYYCFDGSEFWMWHRIVSVNKDFDELTITWVAQRGKADFLADPLTISLSSFKSEFIKGEWRLGDIDDNNVPIRLLEGLC